MKTILKLITALLFTLYTIYHTALLVKLAEGSANANVTGRILGVSIVFMISVASWFALIPRHRIRIIRTIMLSVALSLTFILKFFNAEGIFTRLDFANIPSVLNCAVFVICQTALLILLIYYLVLRHNKKLNSKRRLVVALMSVVSALYAICLVMECVLLIKYRFNIELSLKYTLASRFLYYFGFIGMAISFMQPTGTNRPDSEQYLNSEQSEADIIVSSPERNKPNSDKDKKRSPVMDDADIIISSPEINKSHSHKDKKKSPVMDDADIFISSPEINKSHSHKDKKRSPVMDDADIFVSSTEMNNPHSNKDKKKNPVMDDADIVFSTVERGKPYSKKHKK